MNIKKAISYWQKNKLDAYDFVLALPDDAPALNERICSRFQEKIGERRGCVVQGEYARMLVQLYSLYAFTNRICIGSFDLPHGRKLRNLLSSGIATEEDLINDVILGAI